MSHDAGRAPLNEVDGWMFVDVRRSARSFPATRHTDTDGSFTVRHDIRRAPGWVVHVEQPAGKASEDTASEGPTPKDAAPTVVVADALGLRLLNLAGDAADELAAAPLDGSDLVARLVGEPK